MALALSIKCVALSIRIPKNGKKISMASISVHYQKTKFESMRTFTPPIHILTHVLGNTRKQTWRFSVLTRPLLTATQTWQTISHGGATALVLHESLSLLFFSFFILLGLRLARVLEVFILWKRRKWIKVDLELPEKFLNLTGGRHCNNTRIFECFFRPTSWWTLNILFFLQGKE